VTVVKHNGCAGGVRSHSGRVVAGAAGTARRVFVAHVCEANDDVDAGDARVAAAAKRIQLATEGCQAPVRHRT
jgi:hypothetical protein